MGISFSHSDASWSYSGFHDARAQLAAQAGIPLRNMEGFCKEGNSWVDIKDPIAPFLNHSDCDGSLTPAECLAVAPRVRELVENWADDNIHKERFLSLAEGMEEAAAAGETFLFT